MVDDALVAAFGAADAGTSSTGLLVLLGIARSDTATDRSALVARLAHLRILEDPAGRMNLSLLDLPKGHRHIILVPNFTLAADCTSGRRPSFDSAMPPADARIVFNQFADDLRSHGLDVQCGIFGSDMKVELVNEGPVTVVLDSVSCERHTAAG